MKSKAFIQEIVVEDERIRRSITPASVRDLADDIAKNGLYHAILIRKHKDYDRLKYTEHRPAGKILVAGERRLQALQLLKNEKRDFFYDDIRYEGIEPFIPVTWTGTTSEADALEMEIHENFMRKDLDWRDIVSARHRLDELRKSEAERVGETWGQADTARELSQLTGLHPKYAEQAVASANRIAPYLDDPLIKNAKSEHEATKLLNRQIEGEFRAALLKLEKEEAAKSGAIVSGLPKRLVLLHGDFSTLDTDGKIPHDSFDTIIADPPYGINADTAFGDAAKVGHSYKDDPLTAITVAKGIFERGFQWTRKEAHLFMFCDVNQFVDLRELVTAAGWKPFRTPIIWYHHGQGHVPWMVDHFRRNYDMLLYASKGGKPLMQVTPDVVVVPKERDQDTGHGARKPPLLYEKIMQFSCLAGSTFIDPCCGSGPIFPAAKFAGMKAWGIEQDEQIYKSALAELGRAEDPKGETK